MTDALPCEVIPYARFLEYQDRRPRLAAHVAEWESTATIDLNVAPPRVHMAGSNGYDAQQLEAGQDGPGTTTECKLAQTRPEWESPSRT